MADDTWSEDEPVEVEDDPAALDVVDLEDLEDDDGLEEEDEE